MAALLVGPGAAAQTGFSGPGGVRGDTTVVPGPEFEVGGFRRFLLGTAYRDLWATPIRVPFLDLATFAGGLTPIRAGGGGQTRVLRFRGDDGLQYIFRSLEKDRSRGIEPELRETVYDWVLQDLTSAQNPVGFLMVAPIMEAVGLLHPDPVLVLMPDDAKLAEYRADFAGLLGSMEVRPEEGDDGRPGYLGSRDVISTFDLYDELEDNPRNRVHAREYLASRLVDMLVGDKDRHADQWRWVRVDEPDGRRVWRPFARDRDEALVHHDGFVMGMQRGTTPKLVRFGPSYPTIRGLTWNGWDMDRQFLAELDKSAWDEVVDMVRSRVTDAVIGRAVQAMPSAMREKGGERLGAALRERRDALGEAASEFYRIVSEEPEVWGTDTDELVRIFRESDGSVRLTLSRDRDRDRDRPYFQRRFSPLETSEIRLYLRGGDDRVIVDEADGPTVSDDWRIQLRIVGGGGSDMYDNRLERTGSRTAIYDEPRKGQDQEPNAFFVRPDTHVDESEYDRPSGQDQFHRYALDWGKHLWPASLVDYNSDHGFIGGTGKTWMDYGFRKEPYERRLIVRAGGSTDFRWILETDYHHVDVAKNVDARVRFRISGVDKVRFHDFGNDTGGGDRGEDFAIDRYQAVFEPSLVFKAQPGVSFGIGPLLKWTYTERDEGGIIDLLDGVYGDGHFVQAGGAAQLVVEATDHDRWPRSGLTFRLRGEVFPRALDVTERFETVDASFSGYVPIPGNGTISARIGGRAILGDVPYHEAASIGSRTVRGLDRSRFSGDASLYANLDLRTPLFRAPFPVLRFPTEVGIVAFVDAGRVYVDGESPGGWHRAVGGGLWFAPVNRGNTLRVTVAKGEELRIKVGMGFLY